MMIIQYAHALCMLNKKGYRHTFAMRNTVLIAFYGNNGFAYAPQYYLIRTLPFLLISLWFSDI
jgi:hypothetical protein